MTMSRSLLRTALAATLSIATLAPALAAPPDGMVAINYNRCDSNYDDWGLHIFQRGPGGPAVPGVSGTTR